MAKPWSEVAASDAFKSLPPEQQDGARRQYFDDVVAPRVPAPQRDIAWDQFATDTGVGRRALPAGVEPSRAGGGRGSVNPGALSLDSARRPRASDAEIDTLLRTPINSDVQQAPATVLEGMTFDKPQFDPAEAERLSGRAYAEATPAPGEPRRAAPVMKPSSGPDRVSDATYRGQALQDASLPVRAAFKAVSGVAKGAGGLIRGAGDLVGSSTLQRAGVETTKGAEEFQKGMGETGPVDGFGPKSPVPYLSDMGEGAASSLGQSAAYASMFGAKAVIPLMSVMSAGEHYDKARTQGLDPAMALAGALPKGAFEAIGEKFSGLDKVAGAMGTILTKGASAEAKKGAADILIKSGIKEIPGEVITYLGQTGVDLLPGIGLNPDLTMGQFVDGLRDTVVQAGMMGSAMGVGGAALRQDPRIKRLRDAGETGAADLLQGQLDKANTAASVDNELAGIAPLADFAATPEYQADYRALRTEGVKPVEAAGRSAVTSSFRTAATGAGMSEKAVAMALDAAKKTGLDKLPGFFQRYTQALAKRGLIQAPEGADALGAELEGVRDHAMNAAMGVTLQVDGGVRNTMAAVEDLEAQQNPAPALETPAPAATETIAPEQPAADLAGQPIDEAWTAFTPESGTLNVPRADMPQIKSAHRGAMVNFLKARGIEAEQGEVPADMLKPTQAEFSPEKVTRALGFDGTDRSILVSSDGYVLDGHHQWLAKREAGENVKVIRLDAPIAELLPTVKEFPSASQSDGAIQEDINVQNPPVRPPGSTEAQAQTAPAQAGAPAGSQPEGPAAAGADTGAPPLETPRVILGRNNVPIAEGGKAFKTRRAADDARKLQPMMRVIRADGGYALTEKTPAQLAAQEMAAQRLRNPQTSPPGQPIPAHAMIAAAGGLSGDERADMGMEGNITVGNRKLFAGAGKGLMIERATEKLIEEGYLPEGAGHDQARALIKRSLTQPQYTAEGFERMAEAETQARFDAAMTEEEAIDDAVAQIEALSDNQFDALLDAEIPWDAPSNTDTVAAMKALGFTDQEIEDATANQSGEPQDDRSGRGEPDEGATSQAHADSAGRDEAPGRAEKVNGEGATTREPSGARDAGVPALEKDASGDSSVSSQGQGNGSPGSDGNRRKETSDTATVKQTPSTEGVSVSAPAFESKLRADGTLAITGDAKAIRELLTAIPAKSMVAMKGGILVGRTQADKAAAILRGEKPKLTAREAAEAGAAAREAEKKAKAAAARAKPASEGLKVGIMPGNAEPVTVKDGIVYIGKAEALDFDSGEPVRVKEGASDAEIVNALKVAGALSRRQRVFGLVDEKPNLQGNRVDETANLQEQGLTAPTKEDVLAQQQRAADGAKAEAKAATESENKAKADAERNEFTLTGSDRATDVGAAGGQGSMFARQGFDADAFARMFRPPTAMAVTDVQKAVDKLTSSWKSGPTIKVVATPADLPINAPADARGLVQGNQIYIVASNHVNRDWVAKTLGHEAIGHYGLWRMLGDEGTKRFNRNLQLALKSGNVPLNKLRDKVRAAYVDEKGRFNLTAAEESSEIAAFAVEDAIDPATGEFKPGFGFIKEVYAKIAEFLRSLGIDIKFTNSELHGMLVSAMRGLEAGARLDGGGQVLVAAARDGDVASVLLALGQNDSLYQIPRSGQKDLEGIASDKGLKVSDVNRSTTDNKLWMIANTTPADAPGVKSWIVTQPNGSQSTLTNDNGKVYINVSAVGEGNQGSQAYDLAANYAFNNGLKFIGDPNGVSPAAMRRRLENMLSSAVKYGTTDHLAPHPDQLKGNKAIGVPALKWTDGDTTGNINAMVDASVGATESTNPVATNNVFFDAATQSFRDGEDNRLDDAGLATHMSEVLDFDGRARGTGQAGNATVRRNALFRSLLSGVGARRAALEAIHSQRDSSSTGSGGALEKSFYARGATDSVADTPAFKKWFGDSKVVDATGKPLVVYHGTNGDISEFKTKGGAIYLTASADYAARYANGASRGNIRTSEAQPGANVMPVYVKLENPFITSKGSQAHFLTAERVAKLKEQGHDGILYSAVYGMPGVRDGDATKATEVVVFNSEQIKSAIGNNGDFDGGNPNIAFARGTGNLFQPNIWTMPDATRTDRVIYELQDGKVDLKRAQEAIKASGQAITEQYDARLAETLYPGRVAYRSKSFLDTEAKPLLEAMARNKVEMDELADYLHARGAEERNAQIAKVNPNMPDGGAGTNTKGELMTNQAARDYLANVPRDRKTVLDAMAKRVDTITAGTRALLVAEGLEKQETIDAWEGAYKNYVPMFRDEAETAMPPHPQGAGFQVKGNASRRATGSTKEVTNILAHVLMQREAAITRAEKNRVALALYGQALSHPNPDFWTTIRPGMKAEQIADELVAMGVDPMTAEVGMEGVPTIRTVDPVTNKVVDRPNPIYRNLPGAIPLKVNGADRVLMLNVKTERGQRLATSLKNLDGLTQLDLAGHIVGRSTRFMAAMLTQYNPAFGLVNVTRDVMSASVNLTSTELSGKSTKVVLNAVPSAIGIARELFKGGQTGTWQKLYRQFQADGGQTGFKDNFRDPNERAKAVEKELAALQKAGTLTAIPGRVTHLVMDLLDGFNTTLENAVRLSAYKAALDKGISRAEAARLGRELTVDFNRKGRLGRELGPLYAFFNASVQGSARTIETLRGPRGGLVIAGGIGLGVLQALMLAAAGYEDDEVAEFIKARTFVIPMNWTGAGDKTHILIPMGLGLHILPNIGRVFAELTLNGGKDIGKRSVAAIGEIAGAFNPLGGGNIFTADGALKTVAPTLLDPVIEMLANKDFTGKPIEKESYGGETDNRPGIARVKLATQRSTTGQAYMGISKAINFLTGGTDYEAGLASPTPEMVRYMAQTVGGGVLREFEKTINASTAAARGEKVRMSGIPVAGRFYGEVDDDQTQTSRYFENSRKVRKVESSVKAARKAGDDDTADAIEDRNPEAALIRSYNRTQRALAALNKEAVQIVGDVKEMAVVDKERAQLMREFNEDLEELERESGKITLADRLRTATRPKLAEIKQ